jgi:hypothetical protein
VERGLQEGIDGGLAAEIGNFAGLIQRPEARNLIQTLFLGRQDYEKRRKSAELPAQLEEIKEDVEAGLASAAAKANHAALDPALRSAGFTRELTHASSAPVKASAARTEVRSEGLESAGLWFEAPKTELEKIGARVLGASALAAARHVAGLGEDDQRVIDYVIVRDLGFPAYLGGPFALLRYMGSDRLEKLLTA